MNTEQVNRKFDEIARVLQDEDAGLLRRVERLPRRQAVHALLVFALISAGGVLLVAGFAILSPVAWCAGVAAFMAAFLVDRHFNGT